MLKLTKKADYGLIAVKHLAECGQGACSAKDIAEAYGMPPQALAKILQRLVKAGVLQSQHGTNGGYALARDARSITAFEVIKSIDGPLLITSCTTKHGDCEQSLRCTVREPLRKVNESIQDVLNRITIAEMKDGAATDVHGHEEKEKPAAELVGITAIAN